MEVLRRKLARAEAGAASDRAGEQGLERAWRLALARAVRDQMALALDVVTVRDERVSLAELVEVLPERALLAVLDTAGDEALGVFALEPAILAGLTGMLTTGRLPAGQPVVRRPTRTDAAMVAPLVDQALDALAEALRGQDDAPWADGWRYASFVDEARPLALMLEDTGYRLLRAEVSFPQGGLTGQVLLAMPFAARAGIAPAKGEVEARDAAFRASFARQVEGVVCRIEAELSRCTLPLARVMGFQVGDTLALGDATIARLVLRGVDGAHLAEGRLGQMRGQRAVRLNPAADEIPRLAG